MTGNQATQMVCAGLKAIYLSGWQVAADANTAGGMSTSRYIRQFWRDQPYAAALRSDPTLEGDGEIDWFA